MLIPPERLDEEQQIWRKSFAVRIEHFETVRGCPRTAAASDIS